MLFRREKKVFFQYFCLGKTSTTHQTRIEIRINEMRQACLKVGDAKKTGTKKNLDLTKDQGFNKYGTYLLSRDESQYHRP